ncbi:hypothetical protein M2351_005425 [Azospirillum canadense]|nr:hypothetical protein [Azospirillum canadense]
MKKLSTLIILGHILFVCAGHPVFARSLEFTHLTNLSNLGFPGWIAQTPTDVTFSHINRVVNGGNASVLVVDAGIFEPWVDIRFIRLFGIVDFRTSMDLIIRNTGAASWQGFLINIIQPVLPIPNALADSVFGPEDPKVPRPNAFTHTNYAHFHPSEGVTQFPGPINNNVAWAQSFTNQGAAGFTPYDQTAVFGYDASIPMGPPTGFNVVWSVPSLSPAILVKGLRIHLTNPGPRDLGGFATLAEDPHVVLRITPIRQ